MTFANPSYLWALAGLVIPLAIHLLSRKEGKVIRVGSLRHVEESNTSQFKSIRLNEVVLLLLRSVMVTALVFFLGGAQCTNPPGSNRVTWLMVEKGIEIADSLRSSGYTLKELPEGEYWKVAEGLGKLPWEVVVLSYSRVENFNGERISLPENVRWISVDRHPVKFPATAWQAGDTVFTRNATSGPLLTSYSTSLEVPDSIDIIRPRRVVVSVSAEDKNERDILMAALNVLKQEYRLPIEISTGADAGAQQISSSLLHLNEKLDQDVALNENLVIELFKKLYPDLTIPETSKEKDARSMPDNLAWSSASQKATTDDTPDFAGIEKYLILLFILSLAAERFVAIRRNQ